MAETRHFSDHDATAQAKTRLPEWRVEDGYLCRSYKTKNFAKSLLAANAIGHFAEAADHHPDLTVKYGTLDVALRTHDADSLTEKDFALAEKIEGVMG
ncbi:4a-hydroxytetrahydrobiopterin dehydratase [Afifella sp. YEN Y35]|uniref:4a-hydroxytetrahydrobiopterin dehydratase n=1 Tax=Afifella sp. YEN Y35 TaxID=3388337 RepID=UPI0039E17FD0